MPVLVRHPEPGNGFALKVELDEDGGLISHNPPVVSRLN
jgi:hypothetical protein